MRRCRFLLGGFPAFVGAGQGSLPGRIRVVFRPLTVAVLIFIDLRDEKDIARRTRCFSHFLIVACACSQASLPKTPGPSSRVGLGR
jgi:hypothetical protein